MAIPTVGAAPGLTSGLVWGVEGGKIVISRFGQFITSIPGKFEQFETKIAQRPFFREISAQREQLETKWLPQAEAALYPKGTPALVTASTERTMGQLEGWTKKPLTAATWFGATTVLTAAIPYVRSAGIATRFAPAGLGGILPEVTRHIPKLVGVGMGAAYGASTAYRIYETPAGERARMWGMIESTEMIPMTAGYLAGVKLIPTVAEKIPYRVNIGERPTRVLIEMGETPVTSERIAKPARGLVVREQSIAPESYKMFLTQPKAKAVGFEPMDVTLKPSGKMIRMGGGKPIVTDVSSILVRPPSKATAGILERFSFAGKPEYVTTSYGRYIKLGRPTRIPEISQRMVGGQIEGVKAKSPIWLSKKIEIAPAKIRLQMPTTAKAIPEFTPDITIVFSERIPTPAAGQPWEMQMYGGPIEEAYPRFTALKTTTAWRGLSPSAAISWGELGVEAATLPPTERYTITDMMAEFGQPSTGMPEMPSWIVKEWEGARVPVIEQPQPSMDLSGAETQLKRATLEIPKRRLGVLDRPDLSWLLAGMTQHLIKPPSSTLQELPRGSLLQYKEIAGLQQVKEPEYERQPAAEYKYPLDHVSMPRPLFIYQLKEKERERRSPFMAPIPFTSTHKILLPMPHQNPYPESYLQPTLQPSLQLQPLSQPDIYVNTTPEIQPTPKIVPGPSPTPSPGPVPIPPPPSPPSPVIIFPFGEGKYERKKKKPKQKQWEWKETWQVPTPQQLIGNVPGVIKAGPGIPTVSQAQMLERMPKNIYKRRG